MKYGITPAALRALASGDIDNFIAASTPRGIEAQEAAGQKTFVSSTTLPRKMLHGCTREKLEQMGITFGDAVDDLFVFVQLPIGWRKQATEHSMWSDLLDNKGRKRAAIFYKAAFYDRKAHIGLCSRYSIDSYVPCDNGGNPVEFGQHSHALAAVQDGDITIHVVGICEKSDYKTCDKHHAQAIRWLNEHFSEWNDPLAYWD